MSAQRAVSSSAARTTALTIAIVAVVAGVAFYSGWRKGVQRELLAAWPASGGRIALVREAPCGRGRCQSIWIGGSREDASQVASLAAGEHCDEIAWAADGYRVGFVIDGYQLRIFDGMTGAFVSKLNLLEPNGSPTSRVARGITFSQNGAAVTFDDCPRFSSGCKSALSAVR